MTRALRAAARRQRCELRAGEVHVWTVFDDRVTDPELIASYHELLTPEESARQQRFFSPKHRHQQLLTRALCRSVLSLYTGVDPADWRFEAGEFGKPDVVAPAGYAWLRFNLSNTDGLVACAVTRDCELGVDVENMQRRGETVAIADRYFSASEAEALKALPESEQRERFFRYWTLKEAYIKARGMGLKLPLGQFSFQLEEGAIRISFGPEIEDEPSAWQFHQEQVSERHMLGLGVRRGGASDLEVRIRPLIPLLPPEESQLPPGAEGGPA